MITMTTIEDDIEMLAGMMDGTAEIIDQDPREVASIDDHGKVRPEESLLPLSFPQQPERKNSF